MRWLEIIRATAEASGGAGGAAAFEMAGELHEIC